MPSNGQDIFFTARDGLRLHARYYGAHGSSRRPVVCLPGLTRNAKDFQVLARWLSDSNRHRREVYALDYRGRGLSAHDPDWRNYTPFYEALDVLDFMSMRRLHDACIIGTSRGGLIAMILATLRPTAIGAVVLNDIGPVIERDGLARIIGYVGRIPIPDTWDEATQLVKEMNQRDFSALGDDEWQAVARQWFNDENDAPSSSYDRNLARSISNVDLDDAVPVMWPQFRALSRVPMLTLRGENSDILSAATLERMQAIVPAMRARTVKGQGHAPFLRDSATILAIEEFLIAYDDRRLGQPTGANATA